MRRAAKVDGNHVAVMLRFRSYGFSVLSLARLGDGAPDLLVARNGLTAVVEVKDGSKPPSRRKLRPAQVEFLSSWRGATYVVERLEQVDAIAEGWSRAPEARD